jgi:hypothetical protein
VLALWQKHWFGFPWKQCGATVCFWWCMISEKNTKLLMNMYTKTSWLLPLLNTKIWKIWQLPPRHKNLLSLVIRHASPKSAEHSEFRVITMHVEPLRKSTHFLHQHMSPFTTLPSVLFYKEGLYIFMQHSSKHWRGSTFTSLPHHHLVRVGVNTSILILKVSILL